MRFDLGRSRACDRLLSNLFLTGRIKYGNSQILCALYYKHTPPNVFHFLFFLSHSATFPPLLPLTLSTSSVSSPHFSPSLFYSTFPSHNVKACCQTYRHLRFCESKRTSSILALCIRTHFFVCPPFLGLPMVFRRQLRASERHRSMLEPSNII